MKAVDVEVVFTIGELAKRTGLPVRTIRFYSDGGLLPPTERTHAGYRLYDTRAMARLELVKTLRELGLSLPDVKRALSREASVSDLARRHVDALDEQIRRLKLRRSVLRAVAKRGSELEEVRLMNKLASMSDEERKRLLDEFWAEMVAGLDVNSELYTRMRSAKPELPDDPSPEQLEAWIEFAELISDPDFRALIRTMSETNAENETAGRSMAPGDWESWFARATEASEAGLTPDSREGKSLADDMAAACAPEGTDPDDPAYRLGLLEQFSRGGDPRAERYWHLLGAINGWPSFPSRVVPAQWIADAIRASAG
jgi:DNA-binding transcriptional MerR regulator